MRAVLYEIMIGVVMAIVAALVALVIAALIWANVEKRKDESRVTQMQISQTA